MKAYVRARLADADRSLEWREVEADTLEQAIKIVEQQDDVEVVLEAMSDDECRMTGNIAAIGGL